MLYEGLMPWEAGFDMFYGGLRLWEVQLYVFYKGLRLWEARFVVFYEGLRLWGGSGSNHSVSPGVSAKERPSRAWGEGEGEGGEARSVVFYEGLRLWEAHLYVFYVSGRFSGVSGLTKL